MDTVTYFPLPTFMLGFTVNNQNQNLCHSRAAFKVHFISIYSFYVYLSYCEFSFT